MSIFDFWNDILSDDEVIILKPNTTVEEEMSRPEEEEQTYDEDLQCYQEEEELRYTGEEDPFCKEKLYPLLGGFENYKPDLVQAGTLDSYLMFLVKGFINVEIRSDLDQHIMELLEDEWFYQWPLVHWAYASRLLHGVGCRKSIKNKKKAIDILLPMARNGCPGALYDIGCCYMNGWHLEQSYVKAIYCWTMASGKGYAPAKKALSKEYWEGQYSRYEETFPVTLRYAIVCANINTFIETNGITERNITEKLSPLGRKEFKMICKKMKLLEKEIATNAPLLMTASLFWDDENNPYKITI